MKDSKSSTLVPQEEKVGGKGKEGVFSRRSGYGAAGLTPAPGRTAIRGGAGLLELGRPSVRCPAGLGCWKRGGVGRDVPHGRVGTVARGRGGSGV